MNSNPMRLQRIIVSGKEEVEVSAMGKNSEADRPIAGCRHTGSTLVSIRKANRCLRRNEQC